MNDIAPGNTSLKKDRITSVTLPVIGQSFSALSMGGLALMLPLIRDDLGLTFAQGGALATLSTLIYALMQIPVGHLTDRFNPKRLFVIGLFGSAGLAIVLGLAQNYWQAVVIQLVSGFFRALLFSPGLALMTGWFPSNRRATAMGLFLIGGQTGNIIFNLIGPLLVNLGVLVGMAGWRFAFITVASLGLLAAILLGKIGKEPAFQTPRSNSKILEVSTFFAIKYVGLRGIQFVRFSMP
jgi:MFS family permease